MTTIQKRRYQILLTTLTTGQIQGVLMGRKVKGVSEEDARLLNDNLPLNAAGTR